MVDRLSSEELAHFERKLRGRQTQLLEELQGTELRASGERYRQVASEAPDAEDASLADLVGDVNAAEMVRDTDELHDAEEALERVASGSYGLCLRCGELIDRARLEAFPTAKYDLHCQEIVERERGQPRPPTL